LPAAERPWNVTVTAARHSSPSSGIHSEATVKAPSVRTLLSLMIVAVGVHSGPLWGQTAAEPPKSRIQIPYQRFVLPNGLTLIVHEDHKAPIVAVNVWYHVGSKNENRGRTGFAHLFEHLMFNGTENYDKDFFGPLEQAGATDLNGTTNEDRTNYFQNVPTNALDLTLWMAEGAGKLNGHWTYRTELFDAQRVEQMSRHLETLLQSIVANPDAALETLEMFTAAEKEQSEIEATVREDLISEKLLMTTRKAVKLAESVT